MNKTARFRDQHDRLLSDAKALAGKLDASQLAQDSSEAENQLAKLLGRLDVHLAIEDKTLYPRLLESPSREVRDLATRFLTEMGGLGKAVGGYRDKWLGTDSIRSDPNGFIRETQGVLRALAGRIERENNELYRAMDES